MRDIVADLGDKPIDEFHDDIRDDARRAHLATIGPYRPASHKFLRTKKRW